MVTTLGWLRTQLPINPRIGYLLLSSSFRSPLPSFAPLLFLLVLRLRATFAFHKRYDSIGYRESPVGGTLRFATAFRGRKVGFQKLLGRRLLRDRLFSDMSAILNSVRNSLIGDALQRRFPSRGTLLPVVCKGLIMHRGISECTMGRKDFRQSYRTNKKYRTLSYRVFFSN